MLILPKFRTIKLKSLILWAIVLGTYIYVMSILLKMQFVKKNKIVFNRPVVIPYVVVHLDLKGTPLKLPYLESLLPQLQANGANGLLMEYEDMFPYEGRLLNLSADNCYRKTELKKFLGLAKDLGFEIIPLVQTFGHMEHVLKLPEFQHLREVFKHPDSICPSKQESMRLIEEIIEQVVKFHATIFPLKFIHIGCDEVFHLKKCQDCIKRNKTKINIFLQHVKTLSDVVTSITPDTTVLIWDDMLRSIKPYQWEKIDYFYNVQPVYWDYRPVIEISHMNFWMYHKKFKQIWVAPAFKGADGRVATFPVLSHRFTNVFGWMSFMQEYRFGGETGVYNFEGIILTGWSRYTHMDPPCELLPVAFPSLVISLLLVQKFKTGDIAIRDGKYVDNLETFVENHLSKETLQCVKGNTIFNESQCEFNGQNLFHVLSNHSKIYSVLLENENELGVENIQYYTKIGMLNTIKIPYYIATIKLKLQTLSELGRMMRKEMRIYYEEDFVTEYVNQKTYYHDKVLRSTLNLLNNYLKVQSWPRRTKNSSYF